MGTLAAEPKNLKEIMQQTMRTVSTNDDATSAIAKRRQEVDTPEDSVKINWPLRLRPFQRLQAKKSAKYRNTLLDARKLLEWFTRQWIVHIN